MKPYDLVEIVWRFYYICPSLFRHEDFSNSLPQNIDKFLPDYTVSPVLEPQIYSFFVFGATAPPPAQWARASSFTRFLDQAQRLTTFGSNPLDEWSARSRDLYLKAHDTHNRETSIPPLGFEPTISADVLFSALTYRPTQHNLRLIGPMMTE